MEKKESVLIIANLSKKRAASLLEDISLYCEKQKIRVYTHVFDGLPAAFTPPFVDYIIVLGGDGTVLYSARLTAKLNRPILTINLGTLGFLAEVSPDNWEQAFEEYRKGYLKSSKRMMLGVTLKRNNRIIGQYSCLNDCVVASAGMAKLAELKLKISDQEIIEYKSDGLILASPTGSTAYSMAAGGPIVYPELNAVLITPINPFTLSNRPFLVPGTERIEIKVINRKNSEMALTLDGQTVIPLQQNDIIILEKDKLYIDIVSFQKFNFYEVVRKKLGWKGGPYD